MLTTIGYKCEYDCRIVRVIFFSITTILNGKLYRRDQISGFEYHSRDFNQLKQLGVD